MTFKESIQACFRKFSDFNGRARRSEYLYFTLFISLVSAVLAILFGDGNSNSLLSNIWSLATVLPATAVVIRRLHDTNHKWIWYLGMIVPIFNFYVIYLIVFKEGDAGENRYGPNPKTFSDGIVSISVPAEEPVEEAALETVENNFEEPEGTVPPDATEAGATETVKTEEPDIIQQVVHAEYHPTEEIKLDLDEPSATEFPNPLDDFKTCPGCGARAGKNDKFCGLCGTRL